MKYIILLLMTWTVLFAFPEYSRAVLVSSVAGLRTAVDNANNGGDRNILLADGVYDVRGIAFVIRADGITIRGSSGKRESVVLDAHYQEASTSGIFRILASNVTIRDMTLKRPYYHALHISPADNRSTSGITIRDVHIIDPGEQAIKINANSTDNAAFTVNNGLIEECLIELTAAGRQNLTYGGHPCYTGGIDAHWARGWRIRDNVIRGFWCADGLSEHGIHFWNNSRDTLVERNQIIDCDRGIGFGLGSKGSSGGIIRNNMIYHGPDRGYADVGISLESTPGASVYNNTIYHVHDYSAIEYRFSSTRNVLIANNLTNRPVTRRDGASGRITTNLTSALAGWFVNPSQGDLHLAGEFSAVVDRGLVITGLNDDFDGEKRPQGKGVDIGADEFAAQNTQARALGGQLFLLLHR